MSNIVERLRNQRYNATIEEIYADSMEAADEIERLEGDIQILKCVGLALRKHLTEDK